jgi:integrase
MAERKQRVHGIHNLTDRQVAVAKPQPCGKKASKNYGKPIGRLIADGGGLYLKITPLGTKSWVYKYMTDRQAKVMGLGPYPAVSLAMARASALEQARLRYLGDDPLEARAQKKAESRTMKALATARAPKTFGEVAEEYIASKEVGWRDPQEGRYWRSRLQTYAKPLMPVRIDQIDTPLVLRVLKPIWGEKYKLAKKLQNQIEQVMAAATVSGYRTGDNPAQWRGYLDKAGLAAPDVVKEVQGRRALPYADVPALIEKLHAIDDVAARSIEFVILTATRSGEVLAGGRSAGMKWSEIDPEGRTWTIPKERMKAKTAHRVPLGDRAIAILREAESVRIDDRVFPFSYWVPSRLFKKLCPGVDLHGFRSSFRDWCSVNRIDNDVAEKSLAHYEGSKTVKAYLRDDLLELRRPVMERWARFCCGETAPDNVVDLRAVAG